MKYVLLLLLITSCSFNAKVESHPSAPPKTFRRGDVVRYVGTETKVIAALNFYNCTVGGVVEDIYTSEATESYEVFFLCETNKIWMTIYPINLELL